MTKTGWIFTIIIIAAIAGGVWYAQGNEEISSGDAMEDAMMHDTGTTTDAMMKESTSTHGMEGDMLGGTDAGMVDNGVMMPEGTTSDAMMQK